MNQTPNIINDSSQVMYFSMVFIYQEHNIKLKNVVLNPNIILSVFHWIMMTRGAGGDYFNNELRLVFSLR